MHCGGRMWCLKHDPISILRVFPFPSRRRLVGWRHPPPVDTFEFASPSIHVMNRVMIPLALPNTSSDLEGEAKVGRIYRRIVFISWSKNITANLDMTERERERVSIAWGTHFRPIVIGVPSASECDHSYQIILVLYQFLSDFRECFRLPTPVATHCGEHWFTSGPLCMWVCSGIHQLLSPRGWIEA